LNHEISLFANNNYKKIKTFKQAIINLRLFPLNNALPMIPDCISRLLNLLNAAMRSPKVPFFYFFA